MDQKLAESKRLLGCESIDVVLLHAPNCWPGHCTPEEEKVGWRTGWKNLEKLKEIHNIQHIGVSNFDISLMEELLRLSDSKVAVVQNWMDPFHQDAEVRALAAAHHIQYMAYSSFGTQWSNGRARFRDHNPVLNLDSRYGENLVLRQLAERHGVSIAAVVLSWAMQMDGVTIIPRSSSPQHIADNFGFLSAGLAQPVVLSGEEVAEITALDGVLGYPWD